MGRSEYYYGLNFNGVKIHVIIHLNHIVFY